MPGSPLPRSQVACSVTAAHEDCAGAGKSTLLKLMCGDLYPTRGDIKRHSHLVIGRYHQHSVDVLDNKMEVLLHSISCGP